MGFIPAIIGMIAAKKQQEDQQEQQKQQQAEQGIQGTTGSQGAGGGPGWANFQMPEVEQNMAQGGIVTHPTNVRLAESEPEVVMPVPPGSPYRSFRRQ